MKAVQPLVHLHRQRFAAAAEQSMWVPSGVAFGDLLTDQPSLARRIASHWQRAELLAFCEASRGSQACIDSVRAHKLYVCGGVESLGGGALKSVDRFNVQSGEWETLPPMPKQCLGSVGGVLSGRVYVCGGFGAFGRAAARFSPSRHKWEHVPSMGTQRGCAAAAVIGQRLYICGGQDDVQTWRSTELFDAREDGGRGAWKPLPAMSAQRRNCFAAAVGGQLLVGGGFDLPVNMDSVPTKVTHNSAEQLCFASGLWKAVPPMLSPRACAAAAVLRGQVYLCGGTMGNMPVSSVERFDPIQGTWYSCPSMPRCRSMHAAVAIAGQIYICGGWQESPPVLPESTMDCFDPDTGVWEALPAMPRRLGAFCAFSVALGIVA